MVKVPAGQGPGARCTTASQSWSQKWAPSPRCITYLHVGLIGVRESLVPLSSNDYIKKTFRHSARKYQAHQGQRSAQQFTRKINWPEVLSFLRPAQSSSAASQLRYAKKEGDGLPGPFRFDSGHWYHRWWAKSTLGATASLSLQNAYLEYYEETSDKPKWRDSLQNAWPIISKVFKIMKFKGGLKIVSEWRKLKVHG